MGIIKRRYLHEILQHLAEDHEMVFLAGPRQVGKTTIGLQTFDHFEKSLYLNWDKFEDRILIQHGPDAVMDRFALSPELMANKAVVMFDEIHKFSQWQSWIKGFYDAYHRQTRIIVTGSSRFDVYKSGGDSLMGRYFLYRIHPLSVAELLVKNNQRKEIAAPKQLDDTLFRTLVKFGGFPRSFTKADDTFFYKWTMLRNQQLFHQEIRDLTNIQEIAQLEMLAQLLTHQVGQHTAYANLARKLQVSALTVKRWIETLKAFYYCFSIKPWSRNITRSLIKEPKYYLWDWSQVKDRGARHENIIASHLLKAVHYWNDFGLGSYDLYYVKDKQGREVDFLVTKDDSPWFLVESKSSDNHGITPALHYFQQQTNAQHAFQVVFEKEFVDKDCFSVTTPVIVPAKTFLSQLV